jgi:hypothetical protein
MAMHPTISREADFRTDPNDKVGADVGARGDGVVVVFIMACVPDGPILLRETRNVFAVVHRSGIIRPLVAVAVGKKVFLRLLCRPASLSTCCKGQECRHMLLQMGKVGYSRR